MSEDPKSIVDEFLEAYEPVIQKVMELVREYDQKWNALSAEAQKAVIERTGKKPFGFLILGAAPSGVPDKVSDGAILKLFPLSESEVSDQHLEAVFAPIFGRMDKDTALTVASLVISATVLGLRTADPKDTGIALASMALEMSTRYARVLRDMMSRQIEGMLKAQETAAVKKAAKELTGATESQGEDR